MLLALTHRATSPLAETADGVFLVRAGGESDAGIVAVLCQQAALSYIGLAATRVLRRHHQKLDDLEQEFEKLPEHAEWVLTRLTDAVRSFAAELKNLANLSLVGGGFYYPSALQAVRLLKRLTPLRADGHEATEFLEGFSSAQDPSPVLFLSGSRSRVKRVVHESAKRVKSGGEKVFAVTDGNDRELSDASTLAVLLPSLAEMTGSTLSLLLLQWLACHLWHGSRAAGQRHKSDS